MKKKTTQPKHVERTLALLLKKPGTWINIANITVTNSHASKVYTQVEKMLKMMGIRFQRTEGTHIIRVLTDEQIKAYDSAMSGVFSKPYGRTAPTLNGKKFTNLIIDEVH